MAVAPLIFRPIYRPKVWGGRRMAERLGKALPPGEAIGESWECSGLPGMESVVAVGPSAGKRLDELMQEWGPDLYGRARLAAGRFPLLLKYLDAREPLSIQVHPRGAADAADPPAVKHEAWYIIEADPDAVIYRGFRPGVTRAQVAAVAGTRGVVELLNRIPARPGTCLYCPAGTVHALGGGVLVAEVQTPSDVTWRLYDWGAPGPPPTPGCTSRRHSTPSTGKPAPCGRRPSATSVGCSRPYRGWSRARRSRSSASAS